MEYQNELEEMRQQLALLKEKLDQQTIINDNQLRGKLNKISRTINRSTYTTLLVAIIMTPITYFTFIHELKLPLYLWGILVIIMIGGAIGNHLLQRHIQGIEHLDLTTAGQKLADFRIRYLRYQTISFIIVIIFFALFFYELFQRWQISQFSQSILPIAVFLIIGILLSVHFHKQISELKKQIEQSTEE